jgi:hypothetical protein
MAFLDMVAHVLKHLCDLTHLPVDTLDSAGRVEATACTCGRVFWVRGDPPVESQ